MMSPTPTNSREERMQQSLLNSKNYIPLSQSWFHPIIGPELNQDQSSIRQTNVQLEEKEPTTIERILLLFQEEETKINKVMEEQMKTKNMEIEQASSLIQYEFINQNYIHTIILSNFFICLYSSSSFDQNVYSKKLPFFLESCLISFKSLFRHLSTLNPSTQFSLQDLPRINLLLKSLDLSKNFYSSVPSLGVISAYLLIKLEKINDAIIAITPAIIHTGDNRVRKLIKEILVISKSPQSSAEFLIQIILNSVSQNRSRLNSIITNHLGLNLNLNSGSANGDTPSSSSLHPSPWGVLIDALLESNRLERLADDLQ